MHEVIGFANGRKNIEANGIYDLTVTTRVHVRGSRLKLMIENSGLPAKREPDPVLVRTIAQAVYWLGLLTSAKAISVQEIAKREKLTASYVSRVIPLACLAPAIIEDILDSRHPLELHARRLLLRENLPLSWAEQGRQLGFSSD